MDQEKRVRAVALSFAGAEEKPHHGFPSFRVGERIFATMPAPDHLHVMLAEEQIREVVPSHPSLEEKHWGKRLPAGRVDLTGAPEELWAELLHEAWSRLAEA